MIDERDANNENGESRERENQPQIKAVQIVNGVETAPQASAAEETERAGEIQPEAPIRKLSGEEALERDIPSTEEPVYSEKIPQAEDMPKATPQGVYSAAQPQAAWQPYGQPMPQWQPYPGAQQMLAQPYYGYQAAQQPVQGYAQPYCQPAPQPQYYQPQPGWGYPGYMPPMPPKKKMPVGLKVFIWVASILAGIAVVGFSSFLIYSAVNSQSTTGMYSVMPNFGDRDEYDENDDIPDFDDGVEAPDADEEGADRPDVDVTPNNDGITIAGKPEGDTLSTQEVYDRVVKSTVTVAVTLSRNGAEQTSTGTGIIATSDGYIITNSHVVLNSKSSVVEIITYDGEKYEAVVVGMDRSTDLAVLKTNDHNFTPAEFGDSDLLVIGESVVAIGNPGGEKFSGSMTGGYVSGLNREVGRYSASGMTYIQTDAAINPGNSGGPLVNMYGQVVGINSSKIITDGYEGMGFAIPVSKAKDVVDVLLAGGYVEGRTRLGITGTEITEAQSAIYGYPRGFMIAEIDEESAFTGTKAQVGDIITAVDGEVVTSLTDLSSLLTRYSPGDKVTITLNRNGAEFTVQATLLEDKGETQK